MKTKKLNERCERIFDFFCQLDNEDIYVSGIPMLDFIFHKNIDDQIVTAILKDEPNNELKAEEIKDLFDPIVKAAFSLGYVIGNTFEITGSEAKHDLEDIKKLIREKALLPYLGRERKGGQHEKERINKNL